MGMKLPRDVEAKALELAGGLPAARPTPVPPHGSVRLIVTVPVATASEANMGGKLKDALKRKAEMKVAMRAAIPRMAAPLALPVRVTLTRVGTGPRPLDSDNLARALKVCRDVVAEWLGADDADLRIRWAYRQRRGWTAAVVIDVQQT